MNKKFEYKKAIYDLYDDGVMSKLNKLGAEGWEMTGTYSNGIIIIFYFKREIVEKGGVK